MNQIKNKISLLLGCLYSFCAIAQLDTYNYKTELSEVDDLWHSVQLPENVFGEIGQDMNDIRIYGISATDTIEAPYVLKVGHENMRRTAVDFKLLNKTSNSKGYYFTYEVPTKEAINRIQLDFENENFDWKIALEGSQNQNEWFTLLDDYRILSIQNAQTNYRFSNLNFSNAKYRYYRVLVKANEKPELLRAKISVNTKSKNKYQEFGVTYMNVSDKNKQTVLELDLKKRLPISFLKINVSDEIDYYRPFSIEYLSDSVQTEKGWRYIYRNLSSGTLSSIEKNGFSFPTTLAQKLRVTISNYDNQPLTIEGVSTKGYVHELIARFSKPAKYYLAFGKKNDRKPQYDIAQTGVKIPTEISTLTLGKAQKLPKKALFKASPLFENKLWLWLIMGAVILVLGGFTLKMMQKK